LGITVECYTRKGNLQNMKNLETIIDANTTRICMAYAKLKNISHDDAMRTFIASRTFHALSIPETGLCYEMFDAVYEMFLEEEGVV